MSRCANPQALELKRGQSLAGGVRVFARGPVPLCADSAHERVTLDTARAVAGPQPIDVLDGHPG